MNNIITSSTNKVTENILTAQPTQAAHSDAHVSKFTLLMLGQVILGIAACSWVIVGSIKDNRHASEQCAKVVEITNQATLKGTLYHQERLEHALMPQGAIFVNITCCNSAVACTRMVKSIFDHQQLCNIASENTLGNLSLKTLLPLEIIQYKLTDVLHAMHAGINPALRVTIPCIPASFQTLSLATLEDKSEEQQSALLKELLDLKFPDLIDTTAMNAIGLSSKKWRHELSIAEQICLKLREINTYLLYVQSQNIYQHVHIS